MTLSQIIRGDNNRCRFCKECDDIGNCSLLNRNVGWEMANDYKVGDCPKERRRDE